MSSKCERPCSVIAILGLFDDDQRLLPLQLGPFTVPSGKMNFQTRLQTPYRGGREHILRAATSPIVRPPLTPERRLEPLSYSTPSDAEKEEGEEGD